MKILISVLMIILFIILMLLITCIFSKLRIVFTAKKEAGKKVGYSYRLELSVFGIRFNIDPEKFRSKAKKTPKGESPDKTDDKKFMEKLKSYYSVFCDFKELYFRTSHVIYKKLRAEKIMLNLDFGYGDASDTGILTGTIWAEIYNVIAFVARIIRINEPQINVTPHYNEELCSFDCECIISGNIAKLISMVVSIGISYLLIKKNKKGGDK